MRFPTLLLSLFLISLSIVATAAEQIAYRLGAGDLVSISVLMEPDMSVTTRVNSQGEIKMPYVGNLRAAGITADVLGNKIEEILGKDYLVNPQVNVEIQEYRPIYIQGAVKNPGSYAFQPGLTVERAASVAGGFTRRANTKSFSIAREADVGEFDINKAKLRDSVHPGDTITVAETYF